MKITYFKRVNRKTLYLTTTRGEINCTGFCALMGVYSSNEQGMATEVPRGVVLRSGDNAGEKPLPLIIRAEEGKDSVDDLKQWMNKNKDWLASKMLDHGSCVAKCASTRAISFR